MSPVTSAIHASYSNFADSLLHVPTSCFLLPPAIVHGNRNSLRRADNWVVLETKPPLGVGSKVVLQDGRETYTGGLRCDEVV